MVKDKIENTIDILSDPASVLAAFTDQDKLRIWWGVERSLIVLKPGGPYTLTWMISENGFAYVSSGIVRDYDPGQLLEVSNIVYLNPEKSILGPMTLRISVEEIESKSSLGSRVKIVQGGYQSGGDWEWYYDAVKSGWPQALNNLKEYLDHKSRKDEG